MSACRPRAAGVRISYSEVPLEVRRWVHERVGDAEVAYSHVGGMSPGAAVTLRTAGGNAFFVKAVGQDLNQQTVDLFRHEIRVLQGLPPARHRPLLLGAYDDGRWVALLMEHIAGRYPSFAASGDAGAVEVMVVAQIAELTPPPVLDVLPLAATVERWQQRWHDVEAQPSFYLPRWAASEFEFIARRIERLQMVVPPTTLCHFDVRDDNLLIREDGTAVIFDWGMARLGPPWVDVALLAIQQPSAAAGQALLARHVTGNERESVTDFLVAFACSQSWNARRATQPSLPSMAAFCADDARRMFELARLRLEAI